MLLQFQQAPSHQLFEAADMIHDKGSGSDAYVWAAMPGEVRAALTNPDWQLLHPDD